MLLCLCNSLSSWIETKPCRLPRLFQLARRARDAVDAATGLGSGAESFERTDAAAMGE